MSSRHESWKVQDVLEMVARGMHDASDYESSGPAKVFQLYMWKDAIQYALEQVEASID